MQVTRYEDAKPYAAPDHDGIHCLRLQGKEATQTDLIWIGLSHLLPGGHTSMKDAPVEKIYVVVAGEVTIETPSETVKLGIMDSCRLAAGECRALSNRSNSPASVLLAMPVAPEMISPLKVGKPNL